MSFVYKEWSKPEEMTSNNAVETAVSVTGSQRPKRTKRIMPTVLEGEVMAYDAPSDQVFLLNEQASVIWQLCDGKRTVDEIADDVAVLYEKETAMIKADVITAIETFIENGMLKVKS